MGSAFDPKAYWENRHQTTAGLEGVGYLGLRGFNTWMYRVRRHVFRRMVGRSGISARGARVLDIGAGTGVYLEEWRALGAREVVGVELSETACERLRRDHPAVAIHCLDIGKADPAEVSSLGRFDLISMMDVLYHLVEDAVYQAALDRIAGLLAPGGRFIFSENFLQNRPRAGNAWQVSRGLGEIEAALGRAGLVIEQRAPCFVLMNGPVDSLNPLLQLQWKVVDRLARRSNLAGSALGALMYPAELALTRILPESPTSEIAVARRA